MFARIVMVEADPEKIDEGISIFKERAFPIAKQSDGFKAAILLVDREVGRSLGISLWDTEEALEATEQALQAVRKDAVAASEGSAPKVDRYEVVVFEQ